MLKDPVGPSNRASEHGRLPLGRPAKIYRQQLRLNREIKVTTYCICIAHNQLKLLKNYKYICARLLNLPNISVLVCEISQNISVLDFQISQLDLSQNVKSRKYIYARLAELRIYLLAELQIYLYQTGGITRYL